MPTAEKEKRIQELSEAIARSKSIYLADFTGMNVELVSKMRRRLRDAKVEYLVEKNTLTKRALAERGVKGLDPYLEGPTGIAFGSDGFGLIVGNRGLILRTENGGGEWKPIRIMPEAAWKGVSQAP